MSQKILGNIPVGLDLSSDYIVQFTAVDATTGAELSSVTVSSVSLLVDNKGGGEAGAGFVDIEPLFTPIPAGDA